MLIVSVLTYDPNVLIEHPGRHAEPPENVGDALQLSFAFLYGLFSETQLLIGILTYSFKDICAGVVVNFIRRLMTVWALFERLLADDKVLRKII